MIAAAAAAALPAFTNLGSWLADIADRLARGIINDAEAEAEVRLRYSEYEDELASARSAIASSRAAEDRARAGLPHEPPATPGAPTPPSSTVTSSPTTPGVQPGPTGSE